LSYPSVVYLLHRQKENKLSALERTKPVKNRARHD